MSAGKFDSDLDQAIYEASLDGTDAETGDAQQTGLWSGLMRDGESLADVIQKDNPGLDVSELREDGAAGVIVTEDDQGFVKVYYYDDSIGLEQAWAETEDADAEFADEETNELTENRTGLLRRDRIQEALQYVHYWEHRERGSYRMERAEAAKAAIRISDLNDAETDVLLNALHVSRDELKAARNPGKPPPPPPRGRTGGDSMRRIRRIEHEHRTTEKPFDPEIQYPRETKAHHFMVNSGEKTLFQAVVEAGLPYDHHATDLYIKDSPEARRLIEQYSHYAHPRERGQKGPQMKYIPFTDDRDRQRWLEVPFHYDPAWSRREPVDVVPDFGVPYGSPFYMHDGTRITLWRKGQRVRFYDDHGQQVGTEQKNVAPALAYALKQGWREGSS